MNTGDIITYSFGALRRRKVRTTLTSLGVAIGIAAIVSLLSITQGLQTSVATELRNGLDTDTLIIMSKNPARSPLHVIDGATIESIDRVALVVPMVQGVGYLVDNGSTMEVRTIGVDLSKYGAIYSNAFVAQQGDVSFLSNNGTIIIGAGISDPGDNGTLFASAGDPVQVWKTASHNGSGTGQPYQGHVSAVLKEMGPIASGGLSDSAIYIPLEQATALFNTTICSMIIVQLQDDKQSTIDNVSATIQDRFGGQVQVISSQHVNDVVSRVFSTIDLFLIGIGGISLLVAGIGIMNVMTMSMIERTREIGTLKALGMKNRTVMAIFLCEAGFIGLIGGLIGAGSGFVLAGLVAGFLNDSSILTDVGGQIYGGITIVPVLDIPVFFGAIFFGLLVSVVFALYPAWRSSKLSPVEILNH